MEEIRYGDYHVCRCDACSGHVLSIPLLRRLLPPEIWATVRDTLLHLRTEGRSRCAECGSNLCGSRRIDGLGGCVIEVCRTCKLVWLDPAELRRMTGGNGRGRAYRFPPSHGGTLRLLGAESFLSRKSFLAAVDSARDSLRGRNGTAGHWLADYLR